jgi:hypothetical protein
VIGGWGEDKVKSATSFMYQFGFHLACGRGCSQSGQGSSGTSLMRPVARGIIAKNGAGPLLDRLFTFGGTCLSIGPRRSPRGHVTSNPARRGYTLCTRSTQGGRDWQTGMSSPRYLCAKLPSFSLDDDRRWLGSLGRCLAGVRLSWRRFLREDAVGSGGPLRMQYLAVLGCAVVWGTLTGPRGYSLRLLMARQTIAFTETFTWYTWPSACRWHWQFLLVSRASENPAQLPHGEGAEGISAAWVSGSAVVLNDVLARRVLIATR